RTARAKNPRKSFTTQQFINTWMTFARRSKSKRAISDSQSARQLIHHRERALKGALARLENRRALETWGGSAGSAQFDYRWSAVQTITSDTLTGLEGHHA